MGLPDRASSCAEYQLSKGPLKNAKYANFHSSVFSWYVLLCLHSIPDLPGTRQGSDSVSSRAAGGKGLSDLQVLGRIVLNVWRLMRHEVSGSACTIYSGTSE